jgi:hypothetical protein
MCVRCGYETPHKAKMRIHLYVNKKVCPGSKNLLDLTDDIKLCIMENRVYHIPTPDPIVPVNTIHNNFNNVIHQYHQYTAIISNMDVFEKLNRVIEYKGLEIVDFEDSVDTKYQRKVYRLENNGYKDFQLKHDDLLEIINEVSLCESASFEDFNILYDKKIDRLKFYAHGSWKETLVHTGLQQMLNILKSYFLDAYECYIIRKIREFEAALEHKQKEHCLELLNEYYHFIACFDVEPFIQGKSDQEILHSDAPNSNGVNNDTGNAFSINDDYSGVYRKICENVTRADMNKLKRNVLNIIKQNTIRKVEDLNKCVLNLLHVEQEFKDNIMQNLIVGT